MVENKQIIKRQKSLSAYSPPKQENGGSYHSEDNDSKPFSFRPTDEMMKHRNKQEEAGDEKSLSISR